MAVKMLGELRTDNNAELMDGIRTLQSSDYRRRIPEATKVGIQETLDNLHRYRPQFNEFIEALVNRIGSVYARNMIWQNPLAILKRGLMSYGDTIEEIQVGLLRSHTYDPDRDYMEKAIFGRETPEVQSRFHKVNRQEFYKITVNEAMLRRAFLEPGGLSAFVAQLMSAPTTSDNWDEFLLTVSLINEFNDVGGYYRMKIPGISWDTASGEAGANARITARKVRALAETLTFPSTAYNSASMPTFANRDELILFTTPEFSANLDVEALAGAFNIDKAELPGRMITIPKHLVTIPGFEAILTTKDFFVIADTLLENTTADNPVGLYKNFFLHHHEIMSISPFVPAVLLNTLVDDETITVSNKVTALATPNAVKPDGSTTTTVVRGGVYQLFSTPTVTNATIEDRTGIMYAVTGALSLHTSISQTGVLTVGSDETATSLTVYAYSEDDASVKSANRNLSIAAVPGPRPEWPREGSVVSEPEPEPDPAP